MSKFRSGINKQSKSDEVQQVSFRKGNSICNLCQRKENLTYDHIQPQCCGNDQAIVVRRIYADELVAKQVDSKSKNGLKWRTLCRKCNGDLIGGWDDALGEFTKAVEPFVSPSLSLPEEVSFNVRPGAVLRSILGHVVATKTQEDAVTTDATIRDYLIGGGILNSAIKVYCWLYPFHPIVVSRDFTFLEVVGDSGQSPGLVSIIKFFPLAFCVLDGDGSFDTARMTALHQFAEAETDSRADIEIWRFPIVEPGWPERAMGNHVVLGGRTYADSVTTVAPGGGMVTPGKQVQTAAWATGDEANMLNGLHAFAEIPQM